MSDLLSVLMCCVFELSELSDELFWLYIIGLVKLYRDYETDLDKNNAGNSFRNEQFDWFPCSSIE